jgi:hypothetical protein
MNDGKIRLPHPEPIISAARDERPPYLEPYGGDRQWRLEMWGAVVALYGRYPKHLEALKDGWWNDDATVETLCAIATWRAELDDAGHPRDELAFQNQMIDYAHYLRSQGGGVTKAWKPGAPPTEWMRE